MIKERITSLDVFRGFTIMLMTIVNNPGNWESIYPPLEHAKWNGCTPTDLVFPFFIFIMGTAIPFAIPTKMLDIVTFNKIAVRSLRIFCLGFFLNFFGKIEAFGLEGIPLLLVRLSITFAIAYALLGNFSAKVKMYLVTIILLILFFLAYSGIEAFREVRIPGVLQRIGIVYFFTSLLYIKANQKTQILVALGLLLLYWGLMTLIPVPGIGAANFEKGTNLASWLDGVILKDHMWFSTKTWDPEGFLSTIPAIASGIIGLLIGQLLNRTIKKTEILRRMILAGILIIILGVVWNEVFPINKSIWTSSYVLFTSGLATLCLSLFYYTIEIVNYKKWTKFFLIWGVNPMLVFFFSPIISRTMRAIEIQNPQINTERINLEDYFYNYWIVPAFTNPLNASLAYALSYALLWSFIVWILYQKKLVFKA